MATFTADLQLEGFDELGKVLSYDNFARVLVTNLRAKNDKLRHIISAMVKDEVLNAGSKGLAANKALTILLKGSSKPLVDHGDLAGNVGSSLLDLGFAVGVKRVTKDGRNLAAILHQGAVIRVTEGMRRAFKMMAFKYSGFDKGKMKPLKASTTHIVIPPRPFLKNVVENKEVRILVVKGWLEVIHKSFCELQKPSKVKDVI